MSRIIREAVSAFSGSDHNILEAKPDYDLDHEYSDISLRGILALFQKYESLSRDGGLRIPLHQNESANVTGEYIVYENNSEVEQITFIHSETGNEVSLAVEDIPESSIAPRLRFWTRSYDAPEDPRYVDPDAEDALESITAEEPLGEQETVRFFEELREFNSNMREAAREEVREVYNERSGGYARKVYGGIPRVAPIGRTVSDEGEVFRLQVIDETSEDHINIPGRYDLFPGTEVLIDSVQGDSHAGNLPTEAAIAEMRGKSIGVRPTAWVGRDWSGLQYADNHQIDLQVIGLLNPTPFEREWDAIDDVENTTNKREILRGGASLEFGPSSHRTIPSDNLNEYQSDAVERAIRASEIYCIHGPPGTGKTRTLRSVIKAAVADGKRVLACSHSNQAVDNLIAGDSVMENPDPNSLHQAALDGRLSISRVGSNSRNAVVSKNYVEQRSSRTDVVAATTSMAHQFRKNRFDLAVLDEATQASIPASLIPFYVSKKLVLAGDHKQLPPFASDELREREMHISLFEHFVDVYGPEITTLLKRQYRMNSAIAEFSNQEFYNQKLSHGPVNEDWSLQGFPPIQAYHVEGREQRTQSKSLRNEMEIDKIITELDQLLESGIKPSDVGIITPYGGQVGAINHRLNEYGESINQIKVDTVDSFQGGEREVIIVSLVRSNDEGRTGFLTFPDVGSRRLNVALTRARKRLVLIANWETLTTRGPNEQSQETRVYQRLHKYLDDMEAFEEASIA